MTGPSFIFLVCYPAIMANPSFQIDDETLERLDSIIWEKKVEGELDRDVSRSDVIRDLVEEYIEGNGNSSTKTPVTAD